MSAITLAVEQLKLSEGFRSRMYRCPRGFLTIGYGTNIDDGLDREEAAAIMLVRVRRNLLMLREIGLGDVRTEALAICLDMCYQMGFAGFLKFKNTIRFIKAMQYREASIEMLDSAWAKQTPNRALRLSTAMRNVTS